MFNPLVDSFDHLTDAEVEEKIRELSRKFFQSHNPQLQSQVAAILEMYREELRARMARQKLDVDTDSELDNLINIS